MRDERDSGLDDPQFPVDAMRRGYEAVNRRDFAGMVESFDPDIVWHDAPEIPGASVYRGPSRIASAIEGFLDVWEEVRLEIEELIPIDDRVVAVVGFHVRGRGSKVPLDGIVVHVWTWREGKAVRMEAFLSKEQALEAVGRHSRA